MVVVGLTGGPASGKSTVASLFQACGAHVIDADRLARRVIARGTPGWREVIAAFGHRVLNADRTVNRVRLGAIVFHNRRKRQRLEAITHPRVGAAFERRVARIAKHTPKAVVIYDVPLLIEAGLHDKVDRVVLVMADRATQIRRLCERDGLAPAEAARRLKAQLPLAMKRRYADHILDGTAPLSRLSTQVRRLYAAFQRAARKATR